MTTDTSNRVDALVHRLLAMETEGPILTATIDLRVGSSGQPPALKTLTQAIRYAIDESGLDKRAAEAVEAEGEALEAAAESASERGVLGLIYVGAPEGDLSVVELASPVRTTVHVGTHPWVFELARTAYIDRPVALITTDLHTMDVVRLRHGAASDQDQVDWDAHYLTKRKQRTGRENRGGAPGGSGSGGTGPGGASGAGGGGHSYSRQEHFVEEQRRLFVNEAAAHLEKFVQPGDLLVVEGVEEARSQLLGHLPEKWREQALQLNAPVPTEDERDKLQRLREYSVRAQLDAGNLEAARWFDGAHRELALAGIPAIRDASEQGRVGQVILHQDAVTHFGTWADARMHESSIDDPRAVEETLQLALRQAAESIFCDDPRVLEEHGGILAVARY